MASNSPTQHKPQLALHNRVVDIGAMLIRRLEGVIASGSKVGNSPVLDNDAFPWSHELERNFPAIRSELDAVLENKDQIPPFQELSKDQARLSNDEGWKTYFLYAFGYKAERNCLECPVTTRMVEQIPGMTTAFFSIFEPHKRLPDHRGAFKGLLRYHLGLRIPEPASACGIRVATEICHWEEGKSLIFDDTFRHEAWNDTDETRVVLFVDFVRPTRFPANVINSLTIGAIKHSPFVNDAVTNYRAWEAKLDHVQ